MSMSGTLPPAGGAGWIGGDDMRSGSSSSVSKPVTEAGLDGCGAGGAAAPVKQAGAEVRGSEGSIRYDLIWTIIDCLSKTCFLAEKGLGAAVLYDALRTASNAISLLIFDH